MVDLIKPFPKPPWKRQPTRITPSVPSADDWDAVEVEGLEWLLNAPRVREVVFAMDGRAVFMTAPDPRAFCLHKVWLSQRDDREPIKRARDFKQAAVVYQLIAEHLPHLNRDWSAVASVPDALLVEARKRLGSAIDAPTPGEGRDGAGGIMPTRMRG